MINKSGQDKTRVPVEGWPLDLALSIEMRTGKHMLALLTEATPVVRQAIYAAMDQLYGSQDDSVSRSDADLIVFEGGLFFKPRKLIERAFGHVPDGFLGLLKRVGVAPLTRGMYKTVFSEFEKRTPRVKALRQFSGPLRPGAIELVFSASEVLVHPNVVRLGQARLRDVELVLETAKVVCSQFHEGTFRNALELLGTIGLREWANRYFLRYMDRLPYDLPDLIDPQVQFLTTGKALEAAGRDYRNCLPTRALHVAAGLYAYATVRGPDGVLEFRRLRRGWVLEKLYAPGNGRISAELQQFAAEAADRLRFPSLLLDDHSHEGMGRLTAEDDHLRDLNWDDF